MPSRTSCPDCLCHCQFFNMSLARSITAGALGLRSALSARPVSIDLLLPSQPLFRLMSSLNSSLSKSTAASSSFRRLFHKSTCNRVSIHRTLLSAASASAARVSSSDDAARVSSSSSSRLQSAHSRSSSSLSPSMPVNIDLTATARAASHIIHDQRKMAVSGHGEDAHCLDSVQSSSDSQSQSPSHSPSVNMTLLAVFDGVGSWQFEHGIDASLFSRSMADETQKQFRKQMSSVHASASKTAATTLSKKSKPHAHSASTTSANQLPLKLLTGAWKHVRDIAPHPPVGSSTALIVTLDRLNHRLSSVNLGDSCYSLYRMDSKSHLYRLAYQSTTQQHEFNRPKQIGIDAQYQSTAFDSIANDADEHNCAVHPGDVILVASDGLYDNMTDDDILHSINSHYIDHDRVIAPAKLAASLNRQAFELSWNKSIDSPFAIQAKDAGICWKDGGRRDGQSSENCDSVNAIE